MNGLRSILDTILRRRELALIALIVITVIVVSCFDTGFLTYDNWRDILVRSAPTAIVACGLMLVVVAAEIDISVGSLMALLAAFMGLMLSKNEWNLPTWVGIFTCRPSWRTSSSAWGSTSPRSR